jgi:arylsulfatase A-like enzyme
MLRWPAKIRAGRVNDMTEHIDLPHTLTDLLSLDGLPVRHGATLRPYLEGQKTKPRDHVFSQYLENEEAYLKTARWKYIIGSGKRKRTDGYETDNPTPGRYQRLFDLKADPGEFTDVSAKQPAVVKQMQDLLLARYRATHPEAEQEPRTSTREVALEHYLRPRDA